MMATNLKACGVTVEEFPDGFAVSGVGRLHGGAVTESCGDHRIAMCMAVLALSCEAPVTINGVACIDTSYPQFWQDLATLTSC
jgi:3-phosphoshikimate 1-carboxyvinyltransferase